MDIYEELITKLKNEADPVYKVFNAKIISTKYEMLGVRLPVLRRIVKKIKPDDRLSLLKCLQANYYEEVMIKLLLVASIKNLEETMNYFTEAIDLIDNWALCDTFSNSLKIVALNKEYFLKVIAKLLKDHKTYHVRLGLVLLIDYYIEDKYLTIIYEYINSIKSDEYYINMALAWLVSEIFIKYPEVGLKILEDNNMDKFTTNKSISKIRDSYRVNKEMKDYILKFKK